MNYTSDLFPSGRLYFWLGADAEPYEAEQDARAEAEFARLLAAAPVVEEGQDYE